jgi:hypothetical protein
MTTVRVSWFSPAVNHCHNTSCTVWVGCSPWAIACELTACYSTTLQIEKTHSTFALASRERTTRRLHQPPAETRHPVRRACPHRLSGLALIPTLPGRVGERRWQRLRLNMDSRESVGRSLQGELGIRVTSRHERFSLRLHGKDSVDSLCEQVVIWHHALMC